MAPSVAHNLCPKASASALHLTTSASGTGGSGTDGTRSMYRIETLLEDPLGRTPILHFEGPRKGSGRFFVNLVSVRILWLPERPSPTKSDFNITDSQAMEVTGGRDCVKS